MADVLVCVSKFEVSKFDPSVTWPAPRRTRSPSPSPPPPGPTVGWRPRPRSRRRPRRWPRPAGRAGRACCRRTCWWPWRSRSPPRYASHAPRVVQLADDHEVGRRRRPRTVADLEADRPTQPRQRHRRHQRQRRPHRHVVRLKRDRGGHGDRPTVRVKAGDGPPLPRSRPTGRNAPAAAGLRCRAGERRAPAAGHRRVTRLRRGLGRHWSAANRRAVSGRCRQASGSETVHRLIDQFGVASLLERDGPGSASTRRSTTSSTAAGSPTR